MVTKRNVVNIFSGCGLAPSAMWLPIPYDFATPLVYKMPMGRFHLFSDINYSFETTATAMQSV